MKKYKLLCGLGLLLSLFAFTACAASSSEPDYERVNTGVSVSKQTTSVAYKKEELTLDNFYLLHDGLYYPIFQQALPTFTSHAGEYADPERRIYIDSMLETEIPTLFLGNEDKIIYYSQDQLLDYITWERFSDEGYTVGLKNIQTMKSGRVYIDSEQEPFIDFSDTAALADLDVPYFLLDKISGVQLNSNGIKNGMITGLTRNGKYNLELYVGTQYLHHLATANVKVLQAMEVFASVEYKTLQANTYEIDVPDYLTTGYYTIENQGVIRIVDDDSYSPYTYYNEPILRMANKNTKLNRYSAYPPLNLFVSDIPGAFGYNAKIENNSEDGDIMIFREAAVITRELFFPPDIDCKIKIKTSELAGESYVTIGSKRFYLQPGDDGFSIDLLGTGKIGTLTITSFYQPLEIGYYGCTEDVPQISVTDIPVTEEVEELKKSGAIQGDGFPNL